MQHVALETRREDVPAALAFWALLGFDPVPPPGSLGERSAWVERDGRQVHLMFRSGPVVPPSGHVAVVAADYDETWQRLRAAGFEPEAHEQHWGVPRAFVTSPGGHRVEIMASPPP